MIQITLLTMMLRDETIQCRFFPPENCWFDDEKTTRCFVVKRLSFSFLEHFLVTGWVRNKAAKESLSDSEDPDEKVRG